MGAVITVAILTAKANTCLYLIFHRNKYTNISTINYSIVQQRFIAYPCILHRSMLVESHPITSRLPLPGGKWEEVAISQFQMWVTRGTACFHSPLREVYISAMRENTQNVFSQCYRRHMRTHKFDL